VPGHGNHLGAQRRNEHVPHAPTIVVYKLSIHSYLNCVGMDGEYNEEDEKERRQLIEQVFELQNTLDGKVFK